MNTRHEESPEGGMSPQEVVKKVGLWTGVFLMLTFWIFGGTSYLIDQKEKVQSEPVRQVTTVTRVVTPDGPSCPTPSLERMPITAPAKGKNASVWPDNWIAVPRCHKVNFCDPKADPGCSETDPAKVNFEFQNKSLAGETHAWTSKEGEDIQATRVRSKSSKPHELLYWFEFDK